MINTQEIRAGNQVFFDPSGSTVTILKVKNDTVLLDTFPQSSYHSNNDISGIPITTSMLRKLSFTNEEESTTWVGEGIHIHVKQDGFFYGLRILKSRTKMQYLHELQNYVADFYALFREENHSLNLSPL